MSSKDTVQERLDKIPFTDHVYIWYDLGPNICLDGHFTREELIQIIDILPEE